MIMDIEIIIDSSTIDFIIISGTSISSIGGSIPVQQQGPSSLFPIACQLGRRRR